MEASAKFADTSRDGRVRLNFQPPASATRIFDPKFFRERRNREICDIHLTQGLICRGRWPIPLPVATGHRCAPSRLSCAVIGSASRASLTLAVDQGKATASLVIYLKQTTSLWNCCAGLCWRVSTNPPATFAVGYRRKANGFARCPQIKWFLMNICAGAVCPNNRSFEKRSRSPMRSKMIK